MSLRNVILVEDEPFIAIMVEEMLVELGWDVAGTAYNENDAFTLLEKGEVGLALLDVDLGKSNSLAVAATCRERNIPIVFMTGYTVHEVPEECGDALVLTKPFTQDDLQLALARARPMRAFATDLASNA
jgi:CheY-like chemotaxis protein